MKYIKSIITILVVVCCNSLLSANSFSKTRTPLLTKLLCTQQIEDFNDEIYNYWLKDTALPKNQLLEKEIQAQFGHLPQIEFDEMLRGLFDYYRFLTEEISTDSNSEKLKVLTALEIGDHSTPEMEVLQKAWSLKKTQVLKIKEKFSFLCSLDYKLIAKFGEPPPPENPPVPPPGLTQALWGLRVAFATSYQSCKVLNLPAMDEDTESLEGIVISGKHKDGVGNKRVYKSIPKIFASHYYYKNILPLENSCYLPSKNPLIYDYGGKPATSADDYSTLDFFTNKGSGTKVLGLDCSAFVFSATARAGLRITSGKPLKAALVHGISARLFKDPKKNGLSCFAPITLSAKESLVGGEIAAINGHVVMIDDVGSDPFGIANIKSASDCDLQHIDSKNFQFSILQSSTYKNAIGIGKAKASAYLQESKSMLTGFQKYAIAACLAQFGKPQTPNIAELTVIRNQGSPDCINDNYIALEKEQCVSTCRF